MNRLFSWGILIALLILIGSGIMALRIVFVSDEDVVVPSLVGLTAVEAANRLQSVGLSALIDQVESEQPEGEVIHQSISTGQKVEKGKVVNIRISKGGTQIQIPDVRGMAFAEATKTLDSAGFKIGSLVRVSDPLKPAGTVIAQNPAAPGRISNSRLVELLVSEGQTGKTEIVLVPDLRGQSETLARQIIEQSNLTVAQQVIRVESNTVPAGSVVSTQPRAGSRVPSGNALTLRIARSADVASPNTGTDRPIIQTVGGTSQNQSTDAEQANTQTAVPVPEPQPDPEPQQAQTVETPPLISPPAPAGALPTKTAKIRYQVPPLSRPLSLKIEITDRAGSRVLRELQAKGGEYFTIDTPYSGNAGVTVQLGGELVWQERYQ